MDETDILLIRAAAQILGRYGTEVMATHDHLSTTRGFVGFRAKAAACELRDFLAVAEKYGLPAADDIVESTVTPSRPDWGDDGDNPGYDR